MNREGCAHQRINSNYKKRGISLAGSNIAQGRGDVDWKKWAQNTTAA